MTTLQVTRSRVARLPQLQVHPRQPFHELAERAFALLERSMSAAAAAAGGEQPP